MDKKKVAFICVHNSCRSQIAEALGHYLASDVFESYSAGTDTIIKCALAKWTGLAFKIPCTSLEECKSKDELK